MSLLNLSFELPQDVARTIVDIAFGIRAMSYGVLVFLCMMILFKLERIYREERIVVYRRHIGRLTQAPPPHRRWRTRRLVRFNRMIATHERHLWNKRHFM